VTRPAPAYGLDDLLRLMARLRDPGHGCPWDQQQSFASIVPHTLEEAYEVADAIAQGDFAQLEGELGDLLFQVVYYAQLGREAGHFDWDRVVDGITRKLIRRHPHVFPDGRLDTPPGAVSLAPEQIKRRWEEIKAEERAERGGEPHQLSLLDKNGTALPATDAATIVGQPLQAELDLLADRRRRVGIPARSTTGMFHRDTSNTPVDR
jgi:nucleoside triphosphate diphosphatase